MQQSVSEHVCDPFVTTHNILANKTKNTTIYSGVFHMVEMTGVEPVSKNPLT